VGLRRDVSTGVDGLDYGGVGMRRDTYYHNWRRTDWPWRVVCLGVAVSLTREITGLESMSIQASSRNWRGFEVRVGSLPGKKKLK
jgi:hypothetical protein